MGTSGQPTTVAPGSRGRWQRRSGTRDRRRRELLHHELSLQESDVSHLTSSFRARIVSRPRKPVPSAIRPVVSLAGAERSRRPRSGHGGRDGARRVVGGRSRPCSRPGCVRRAGQQNDRDGCMPPGTGSGIGNARAPVIDREPGGMAMTNPITMARRSRSWSEAVTPRSSTPVVTPVPPPRPTRERRRKGGEDGLGTADPSLGQPSSRRH